MSAAESTNAKINMNAVRITKVRKSRSARTRKN